MKRKLKRSMGKSINMFNYIKKIVGRIFKITIQSAIICYPLVLVLIIMNSMVGVNVSFSYYTILATFITVATAIILCAFKWEQIIAKPVKISKKTVIAKANKKTQRVVNRNRKRIS